MKKALKFLFVGFAAVAMTFGFASCANDDDGDDSQNSNPKTVLMGLKNNTGCTIPFEIINDSGDTYKSGTLYAREYLPMNNFLKGSYRVKFRVQPYYTKYAMTFEIKKDCKIVFYTSGNASFGAKLE